MINSTMSDIDSMSESELKEYIAMATVMQHKFDKLQHSAKILLNSLYGALGTPYFRFFNIWCAEAITLTGQSCTAQSYAVFNEFQQGILGDNVDRVIAGDTDSVVYDTIININGKDIKIGDYYEGNLVKEIKINGIDYTNKGVKNILYTEKMDESI